MRATGAEGAACAAEDQAKKERDLAVEAENEPRKKLRRPAPPRVRPRKSATWPGLRIGHVQVGGFVPARRPGYGSCWPLLEGWRPPSVRANGPKGPPWYLLAYSTSREGENTPRLNGCSNEWHSSTRIGASQQAAAYRQELEAVRKLEKSPPASASNVVDFPKGTFTLKGPEWRGLGLKLDGQTKFTLNRNDKFGVEGTYKLTKNEVEFTDEKGLLAEMGAGKTGTYKWKLDNGNLTFTRVTDEGARAAILTSGPWEKKE